VRRVGAVGGRGCGWARRTRSGGRGCRRRPIASVPPQLVPAILRQRYTAAEDETLQRVSPFFIVLAPSYLQAPRLRRQSRGGRRTTTWTNVHHASPRPASSSPPRTTSRAATSGTISRLVQRAASPPLILPRAARADNHRRPPTGLPDPDSPTHLRRERRAASLGWLAATEGATMMDVL
jgi:hypothetical protein